MFSLYHMDAQAAQWQIERERQVGNHVQVWEATRKPKARYRMLLRLGELLQARNQVPATCC